MGMLDNLSNNCLLVTIGILNTFNIDYKFTQLDICIDVDTKMQNILAICTTKLQEQSTILQIIVFIMAIRCI